MDKKVFGVFAKGAAKAEAVNWWNKDKAKIETILLADRHADSAEPRNRGRELRLCNPEIV